MFFVLLISDHQFCLVLLIYLFIFFKILKIKSRTILQTVIRVTDSTPSFSFFCLIQTYILKQRSFSAFIDKRNQDQLSRRYDWNTEFSCKAHVWLKSVRLKFHLLWGDVRKIGLVVGWHQISRPICGIGLVVGVVPVCGTDPVCKSYRHTK